MEVVFTSNHLNWRSTPLFTSSFQAVRNSHPATYPARILLIIRCYFYLCVTCGDFHCHCWQVALPEVKRCARRGFLHAYFRTIVNDLQSLMLDPINFSALLTHLKFLFSTHCHMVYEFH